MTRGLVLGKFAPFHRGHQSLVERSLAETDETVVLIYDSPQVTRVPLERRAAWIRTLYPRVLVIEGRGAPSATGDDPAVMRLQEDYIRSVVPGRVTHFFCSEWYGDHVSTALGATDRRVDPARKHMPISGTIIRSDPFAHRQWLSPVVYRDLVRSLVLLGAESTGKSTLAAALADHFKTRWMPEYGREYWAKNHDAHGQLSPGQLVELARGHRQREDEAALDANRMLIVDTDARTTRQYARWYHAGRVEPALDAMALDCERRYDLAVLCETDIPYVDDGGRAGEARRREAQTEIRHEVERGAGPWVRVSGTVRERVRQTAAAVAALKLDTWC